MGLGVSEQKEETDSLKPVRPEDETEKERRACGSPKTHPCPFLNSPEDLPLGTVSFGFLRDSFVRLVEDPTTSFGEHGILKGCSHLCPMASGEWDPAS